MKRKRRPASRVPRPASERRKPAAGSRQQGAGSKRPPATVHIGYASDDVVMPTFPAATVQAAVEAAVAARARRRPRRGWELAVLFVGDERSAELHGEHFADATPTDVMSFPDGEADPASGRLRLGDLAVGVGVAQRVAAARGRPLADELTLYILHGVLHLLGMDDRDDAGRAAMWAEQRRILGPLGIDIGEPE